MLVLLGLLCFPCLGIVSGDSGRIYNGKVVPDELYHFMAALILPSGQFGCTATILNDDSILTAAHCVQKKYDVNATKWFIYVGHHDITEKRRDKNYMYPVARFIRHEKRGKNVSKGFDVAVIKLARKIKFGPKVAKVCLAGRTGLDVDHSKCMAVGWGMRDDSSTTSDKLMHVRLPRQKIATCGQKVDKKNIICAHDPNSFSGTCLGDSGGPLLCPTKTKPLTWLQYGTDSFSYAPCGKGPEFYMRVSAHIDWIRVKADSKP